jgi:hypothetical protein
MFWKWTAKGEDENNIKAEKPVIPENGMKLNQQIIKRFLGAK